MCMTFVWSQDTDVIIDSLTFQVELAAGLFIARSWAYHRMHEHATLFSDIHMAELHHEIDWTHTNEMTRNTMTMYGHDPGASICFPQLPCNTSLPMNTCSLVQMQVSYLSWLMHCTVRDGNDDVRTRCMILALVVIASFTHTAYDNANRPVAIMTSLHRYLSWLVMCHACMHTLWWL